MSLDISVSHLNNRLALQLPAELPLGLVFVVGVVQELKRRQIDTDNGRSTVFRFRLTEGEHTVRCQLTRRATAEIRLREGDKIRAGGHLVFNPQEATYHLLARDVEVIDSDDLGEEVEPEAPASAASLPPSPRRTALSPVLADIKKRAEAAQMAQANLPAWVQHMAPPEVQARRERATDGGEEEAAQDFDAPPSDAELNQELITFLSAAMEDLDDVEVTSNMLAEMAPEQETAPPAPPAAAKAYEVPPPASSAPDTAVSPSEPPQPRDNATIWLLASFIVLALVILIGISLFLT